MDTRTEKIRLADGVPMKSSEVVALDAVAYLANTAFGSARKVMMALIALHEAEGIPFEDMLQLDDLPLEIATSRHRLDVTERLVRRVAHSAKMPNDIGRALNVRNRFQ